MTYEDLQRAMEIFGLPERASLREIKARHRELVKLHHPDVGGSSDSAVMIRINEAYAILYAYVCDYRFSFSEEEFFVQNPDEQLRRQFADPFWGGK